MAKKTLVILGGSYAGLTIAHKLLKHTYPKVQDFRVVLVSPSNHLFWNMAAPRGIVPGLFTDDQLFQPILPGFEKYPEGSFDFVEGAAEAVDVQKTTVVVRTNAGPLQTLQYNILIIATGASSAEGLPFKQVGSYQDTLGKLHSMQKRVAEATSIVVGGAGTTGVETAGELGFEYHGKGKSITLITNSEHVLPSLRGDVGAFAENELHHLGVKIILNTKVTAAKPHGSTQTELTLSNGTTFLADLYIPTTGLYPNTSFLATSLLNPQTRDVLVDQLFRLTSAPPNTAFAVGDCINVESKQIKPTEDQAVHLARNLDILLTTGEEGRMQRYVPSGIPLLVLTVGRERGTGLVGPWKVWSWVVSAFKGRTMGSHKLGRLVRGEGLAVWPWV